MGIWLDFLQVALALGLGWLGWVLFTVARTAGRTAAAVGDQVRPVPGGGVQQLIPRRRL